MTDIRTVFRPDKPGGRKGVLAVFRNEEDTPLFTDTLDIASDKQRKRVIDVIADRCPVLGAEDLEKALLVHVAEVLSQQDSPGESQAPAVDPLSETPQEVIDVALRMLQSPDLFEQILRDIEHMGVAGEEDLKLMIYIIGTSRLMEKPLSGIVLGASSSGKSYTIETVAKMMPPEAVVQAHDFTDQALFYLPPHSLEHKVVVSGERVHDRRGKDGRAEDNSKAFREMVGSDVLRKAVTIKGPDGRPTTVLIEQPGPIAFLESSTATRINDEDATRLLPLVTDESPEQTRKIIDAMRRAAKGETAGEGKRNEIIQRHHTMQRLLRPIAVRVPYADRLSLPETNVATRRTYPQLLSAIRSAAFLCQYQKQVHTDPATGQDYIEADDRDYAIAHRLMRGILLRKYSPLDSHACDMFKIILDRTRTVGADGSRQYDEFTVSDAEGWAGVSEATARRRLRPLAAVGILSEDASAKPHRYRVVKADLARAVDVQLPMPEEIAGRIAARKEHAMQIG